MSAPQRILQVVVAAALTAGVAGLSRVPWSAETRDHAVIRLAWRHRSALINACRRRTAEELARLPQHMRREEDCQRQLQPYRLEVHLDEALVRQDSVTARGARSDRPLSIFLELPVSQGRHALRVAFHPYAADTTSQRTFALDTAVVLVARQILLVTMDERGTRLTATSSPSPGHTPR